MPETTQNDQSPEQEAQNQQDATRQNDEAIAATAGDVDQSETSPSESPRPEGLDDAYWDGENKSVNWGALNTRMGELEAFRIEQETRMAGVPEGPDGYELDLPEGIELPEGMSADDIEINADDPMLAAGRTFAHEHGLGQKAFSDLLGLKIKADLAEDAELGKALQEQQEKLGEKGEERKAAIETWLKARVGDEKATALGQVIFTAVQVEALEDIIAAFANGGISFKANGQDHGAGKGVEGWDGMTPKQKFRAARERASANR